MNAPTPKTNRNLVVVRAGDESLHESFLGEVEARNWDILISFYGKNPDLFRDRGQVRQDDPRLPFPALYDLIGASREAWARYDYIWFCSDDIVTDINRVNAFFDICHAFNLDLAQPALTLDSRFSHLITIVNKAFHLRFTTFVESMMPCFSYDFLMRCHPSFAMNQTAYGVDFLWPLWARDLSKVAIIDATPARHVRTQGPLYDAFREQGLDPEQEMRDIINKERLCHAVMTTGGVDIQGRLHTIWNGGHRNLIQALMMGYLPEFANHPELIYKTIEPIFGLLHRGNITDMDGLLEHYGRMAA